MQCLQPMWLLGMRKRGSELPRELAASTDLHYGTMTMAPFARSASFSSPSFQRHCAAIEEVVARFGRFTGVWGIVESRHKVPLMDDYHGDYSDEGGDDNGCN